MAIAENVFGMEVQSPPGETKRQSMSKTLILALGGLGFLVIFGGLSFLPSDAKTWPTITNPAALRREAATLCRREMGWRELQPTEYPPAMLKLRPQSISVSGERVYVALVPVHGGKRFHGYYIWPDTTVRSGGGIEQEESDKIEASEL